MAGEMTVKMPAVAETIQSLLYRIDLGLGAKTFMTVAVKDGKDSMQAAFAFCSPTDQFDPERTKAAAGRLLGSPGKKHKDKIEKPVNIVLDKLHLKGASIEEKLLNFVKFSILSGKAVRLLYSRKNHAVYGVENVADEGILAVSGKVRIPDWFFDAQRVSFVARMQA